MSTYRKITMNEKLTEMAVGLFFIAGLVLLAVYTIILNKEIIGGTAVPLQIQFPYLTSLQSGDKILLNGVDVGRVDGISLNADGTVLVTGALTTTVTLYNDCRPELRSSSLVGGRYIYIEPGTPDAGMAAAGQPLKGAAPIDLFAEAGTLVRSLKDYEKRFHKFIEDDGALDKIDAIVDNIRTVTTNIRNGEGTIGKLVNDDALYEGVKETIDTLRDVSNKADEALVSAKSAGDSVRDAGTRMQSMVDQIDEMVGRINKGTGTIGRMINDDALYTDAQAWIADMRDVSASLRGSDSTMGKLLHDDGDFYNTVKSSFATMEQSFEATREIAEKIKDGEGTIGKLVHDDALYNDAKSTFDQVRQAVSDFREQAPIATFGSFIFGAL